MSQRPQLSLTAELEKLEQKITLTLQEIDHNFARAHRIVTTSILPVVERYERESDAVWEGSKFWKQFFEASANVALTNYQEDDEQPAEDETTQAETTRGEDTHLESIVSSPGHYTAGEHSRTQYSSTRGHSFLDDDDSLLDALDLSTGMQSTPKPARPASQSPDSVFAALGRELTMKDYGDGLPVPPPTTPRRKHHNRTLSSPASSSPFRQPPHTPALKEDHIMHRVLDQTWRLQATPIKPTPSRYPPRQPPLFSRSRPDADDDSPISSPVEPQLQTQIFTPRAMRTPLAPGRYVYDDDDSDDDELLGWSPPKTLQFALPPSKLLATPAREASRRIVRDILTTAGASVDGTMTTEGSSPVGKGKEEEEDPFEI